jgi:DNA gyrase subunit A
MLITSGGKIIRMAVDSISVMSRNTMGVRLVRLGNEERVVAVERLAEKDTEAELSEPPPPTVTPPPPGDDEGEAEAADEDESES